MPLALPPAGISSSLISPCRGLRCLRIGKDECTVKIRVGFDIVYDCPQPTPMILTLNVHYSRISDLQRPDHLVTDPPLTVTAYRDGFGNWCSRLVAPAGEARFRADAIVNDPGTVDACDPAAVQHMVQDLPDETLVYLLAAGTATPSISPRPPGSCSARNLSAGRVSRRSVTSYMGTSASATSTPARPGPPGRPSTSVAASAGTSPTWPSPCAAA